MRPTGNCPQSKRKQRLRENIYLGDQIRRSLPPTAFNCILSGSRTCRIFVPERETFDPDAQENRLLFQSGQSYLVTLSTSGWNEDTAEAAGDTLAVLIKVP